jgi:O-Glycosyl hydrolase family 30.
MAKFSVYITWLISCRYSKMPYGGNVVVETHKNSKNRNGCSVRNKWCVLIFVAKVCGKICAPKEYGTGNIVCVCNATYCDDVQPPEELLQPGYYVQYTSTRTGKRLEPTAKPFSKKGMFKKFHSFLTLALHTG